MDPKLKAPVQGDYKYKEKLPGGEVPWAVHKLAVNEYNRHHSQTAERLAERGGLSWAELIACFRGDYSHSGCIKAQRELEKIIEEMK